MTQLPPRVQRELAFSMEIENRTEELAARVIERGSKDPLGEFHMIARKA